VPERGRKGAAAVAWADLTRLLYTAPASAPPCNDTVNEQSLTIVLLGGEGIGPEVVEAAATVLAHLLPAARFVRPPHGQAALAEHGTPLPEVTKEACRSADAILFGAIEKHAREVLRYLRWGLETYANLRPAKSLPGIASGASPLAKERAIDLLIVRENLEGEYPGREGEMAELVARWPELRDNLGRPLAPEGLFTVRVTTEAGTRRVAEVAARQAQARRERGRPGRVTVVTKSNVLMKTDGLFRRVAEEVLDAAGVPHDHLYVDDAARRLVAAPEAFDVLLTPNLFGDILSDVAAELVGGLGMAPSACIGDRYAYFESVHGSAPDIAGKGIANPLATILSCQMMLEHLKRPREAEALEAAVVRLLTERRVLTPDLGGPAGTEQVARELVRLLAARSPGIYRGRPNGPGDPSPGPRPKADALGGEE
jgi:3-isopropylmalate dehydrogenase